MAAAIALGERGRGRTAPNPNVGCVIVQNGSVIGRGWTQPGGRPHAEAMALEQAGEAARGATVYVSLEPCAHDSARGPACADLLIAARPARMMAALTDPDPRTAGKGFARLRAAGIDVVADVLAGEAERSIAGFLTRQRRGRPHVTLKLAMSLDAMIARPDGESKWITGEVARAHAHVERSRCDAILVGRGTLETDASRLDVRLPGLEDRSPRPMLLTSSPQRSLGRRESETIHSPAAISDLKNVDHLLVEGGAKTASAFLAADLVDRLLLYRAPIVIGAGKPALDDIGLASLTEAHDRWALTDTRKLGIDRLEVYERVRD